jgi:hypothetical protein
MLWYSADEGKFAGQVGNYHVGRSETHVRVNFDGVGGTDEERITDVAAQVLDEVQDYVDEAAHDPWPATSTPPRHTRRSAAAPRIFGTAG